LAIDFDEDSDDDDDVALKAHISDELSLMLGVSPPTMFERIQERKRLNLIGCRVRESRKETAKKQAPDVLSLRGTKHKRKQTKEQAEEELMRLQKKKNKMLHEEIPPPYVIRENAAQV
jgi:ribose 1,5-bisphosphokinase PhnN